MTTYNRLTAIRATGRPDYIEFWSDNEDETAGNVSIRDIPDLITLLEMMSGEPIETERIENETNTGKD